MAFPIDIDTFEDGDLTEWTESTLRFFETEVTNTVQTDEVFSGSYALQQTWDAGTNDDPNELFSEPGDGLNRYPQLEDEFEFYVKIDSGNTASAISGGENVGMDLRLTDPQDTNIEALVQVTVRDDQISIGVGIESQILITGDLYTGWIKVNVSLLSTGTVTAFIELMDTGEQSDTIQAQDILAGASGELKLQLELGDSFFSGDATIYRDHFQVTGDTTGSVAQGAKATPTATPATATVSTQAFITGSTPQITTTAAQATPDNSVISTADKPQITATATAPIGGSAVQPPGDTVPITATPTVASGYSGSFTADGIPLDNIVSETMAHNRYTVQFKVDEAALKNTVRELDFNSGKYEYNPQSNGGFRAVDTQNGDNTYRLTPPKSRADARDARTYVVDSYNEEQLGFFGDTYLVTVGFVPLEPREITASIDQTAGTSDWTFDIEAGSIATKRVTSDISAVGEGSGDIKLTVVLTPAQTRAVEETLSYQEGVRSEDIPEGDSRTVDATENKRNTMLIEPPQDGPLDTGTYVVTNWESEWKSDAAYTVTLNVTGVTQPLATGSKAVIDATPR